MPAIAGTRSSLKRAVAAAALIALGLIGRVEAPAGAQPRPGVIYNVTDYGAVGNGTTDSTKAIRKAIKAAERTGGTVYFPSGHYVLDLVNPGGGASLRVTGTIPITLQGQGRDSTVISQRVPAQGLLSITVDGTVLQDLTLDTQSSNGGGALFVSANNTTVQRCTVLSGTSTFAVWYPGAQGSTPTNPMYAYGNQVLDMIVNELVVFDGFSFSYQANGLVQNIDHTGSRLALYVDSDVTVNNYTFHPGTQRADKEGFWITPPSDNITITNFVTYGLGGKMSNNGDQSSSNITIDGEKFMSAGHGLYVGNVVGLSIKNCDFGATNMLVFDPTVAASTVTVSKCTSLPAVRFAHSPPATVDASFNGNMYPEYHPVVGHVTQTFATPYRGTATFAVTNGSWFNRAGGFFAGTNTTYTVTDLEGYP